MCCPCYVLLGFVVVVWYQSEILSSSFQIVSSYTRLDFFNWTDYRVLSNVSGCTDGYKLLANRVGTVKVSKDRIYLSTVCTTDSYFAFSANLPTINNPQIEWSAENVSQSNTIEFLSTSNGTSILICTLSGSGVTMEISNSSSLYPRDYLWSAGFSNPLLGLKDVQLVCNSLNQCILIVLTNYNLALNMYHSYNGYNWSDFSVVDGDQRFDISSFRLFTLPNTSFVVSISYTKKAMSTLHLITFTNDSYTVPTEPLPLPKRSILDYPVLVNISVFYQIPIVHERNGYSATSLVTSKGNGNDSLISVLVDVNNRVTIVSCMNDLLNTQLQPTQVPTPTPTPTPTPITPPTQTPTLPPSTCVQNYTSSQLFETSNCNSEGTLYTNSLTTISGEDVVIGSNWQWITANENLTISNSNITLNNNIVQGVTVIVGNLSIVDSTLNVLSSRINLTGNMILNSNSTINLQVASSLDPNTPLISLTGCFSSSGTIKIGLQRTSATSNTISVIQSSCSATDLSKVSVSKSDSGCTSSKPQTVQRGLNYVLVIPDFQCGVVSTGSTYVVNMLFLLLCLMAITTIIL
eukprot:TRINITY_DN2078_c0_g1_i1.p1 TRINITY_DN2078_c0_g1~~TRINITY_DN2078_c0_g1_i1.p1  ORF type:complete len:576 (-),score=63.51 TRINITY_DN2078_c0_g1_i1:17-1744(-)